MPTTEAAGGDSCRRIVILKCLGNDTNQLARYTGFQRALAEYGLSEQEEHVRKPYGGVCRNGPCRRISAACTRVRLRRHHVHHGHIIAAGALIALREHGLQVPRDVLITGFDDSPQPAAACGPGITSVHQDVARTAQACHRAFNADAASLALPAAPALLSALPFI